MHPSATVHPALGAHVAQMLGIEHQFIEIDNPA
jgi:hypothetical protein